MIDGLPEQVEIAGQQVPISSDFRTGILFEELLQDPGLDDLEKLQTALHLYFPGVAFDYDVLDEALSRLVWFYRCGTDPAETTGEKSGAAEEDPPFSYEHDADYIYSAFMQAYGLDLARHPLHWWQFRALFRSLPEDTQLVKIIGYRTIFQSSLPRGERHITEGQDGQTAEISILAPARGATAKPDKKLFLFFILVLFIYISCTK